MPRKPRIEFEGALYHVMDRGNRLEVVFRDEEGRLLLSSHTDAGRLETRTWARAVVTTYGYNPAGDLSSVTYSDATPGMSGITYDWRGRRQAVTDAGGSRTFTYGPGNQPAIESNTTNNWSVTRGYDSLNRKSTLESTHMTGQVTYGYDSLSGRLSSITAPADRSWSYQWEESLGTVKGVAALVDSTPVLEAERIPDGHGRLTTTRNTALKTGGNEILSEQIYTYNALGQRTEAQREDATRWDYGYDTLGQVISAVRKNAQETTIPGHQRAHGMKGVSSIRPNQEVFLGKDIMAGWRVPN